MRLLVSVGLLLLIGACALFGPSGQRYVVFFRGSSAQLDDQAKGVLVTAGNWANRHPKMSVLVASYTDPYGSETTNVEFTRLRARPSLTDWSPTVWKLLAFSSGRSAL